MTSQILVRGARLHNLKNVDVAIPKNKLVVFSGISGSGKSTLAFDILHKEGQRQYLESLGLAADLSRAPVESITGLSPTISVDQRLANHSPRSTVGTVTEVYSYLRLLYARLGRRPCPSCGKEVSPEYRPTSDDWLADEQIGAHYDSDASAETSSAGTSSAGTSSAGTSSAGTSSAETSSAGTSSAGTSSAGTSSAGTSSAETSSAETSGGAPSAGTPGTGVSSSGSAESGDEAGTRADAEQPDAAETFPCPHCGSPVAKMIMANFSFNKPDGACPVCTGLGALMQPDLERILKPDLSINQGAVAIWEASYSHYYGPVVQQAARHFGFEIDLDQPVREFSAVQRDLLLFGVDSPQIRSHFPTVEPPATVRQGRFEGAASNILRRYSTHVAGAGDGATSNYREKMAEFLIHTTCPSCGGTRLRPESRQVRVDGKTIIESSALSFYDLDAWLTGLPDRLNEDEKLVAGSVLDEALARVHRLVEVGAGYLTLDRASPTLSAGEAQRLRMASLLGSGLTGVLYVLDEPTIGLHQRDTRRLIDFLTRLRDLGNTVLVVEHDLELIAAADHVIDFGPGAGRDGGQVVAAGAPQEIAAAPGSLTGAFLDGRMHVASSHPRRTPGDKELVIYGARANNLQNLTVHIPLGLLVAVTGVSGSGKSSLIFDILDRAGRQRFYAAGDAPGDHDRITGWEHFEKLITIDQSQIGRVPRSNAATYSDAFTPIREAYAAQPEARRLKLSARHFSFNVPGGRCERCQGAGVLTVKMHFLPDVEVRCPACRGRRFTRQTRSVLYRGYSIDQALDMTVAEALDLFRDVPAAASRLQVMADVGLGYLQLGQPATTLSGGEAQRVKLAKELGRRANKPALYLLDEPTTGLHPADAGRLLTALQRLVDAGHTVLVVEHNLDVIQAADWVIDLGPEGGAAGGRLLAQGAPDQIAHVDASYTGRFLRERLPSAG